MSRLLGQLRPSSTEFETLFTVPDGAGRSKIELLNIANVTAAPSLFSLAHVLPDDTADEEPALAWNIEVPGRSQIALELAIPLWNIGETIQVKSSVASALTFSLYGAEQ